MLGLFVPIILPSHQLKIISCTLTSRTRWLEWCTWLRLLSSAGLIFYENTMLFVLICLVSQVAAHRLADQIYEKETTRSLDCKESENWAGMTNVRCAVIAATESIYNIGFVVQEETCMVCRAGGTSGGADVLEISINGPLYVQGGEYSIRRTTLSAH